MLQIDTFGNAPAPRLLLVHGLFGSGRNWRAIAKRLSADFQVTTVDMRNHAGSFWSDDMTYPLLAADLSNVIETIGSPMIVVGHSMGGKAAMALALSRPDLVKKLIVADIAPVAYEHTQTQFVDAMLSVDLSKVQKRSDVTEALRSSVEDSALRAFFAQSIQIDEAGASWRLNLRALKKNMPEIIGWPHLTGQFDGPTFFVAGADSNYIDAAGKIAIKTLFPKAKHTKLKNAGHWLHADQPLAFVETIRAFCKVPNQP